MCCKCVAKCVLQNPICAAKIKKKNICAKFYADISFDRGSKMA